VLAAFLVLATLWLFDAWFPSGGSRGPVGNLGDPLLFVWYLAWLPFSLAHGHNPLFTKLLMAPKGANLLINTSIPLPSFLLAPITALFGPVVSYNVLITLAIGLSAWAAYLAARRIVGSESGAIVCGFLYGFGPYMYAQSLAHAHLVIAVFPPFALAVLHELVVRQKHRATVVGLVLGLGSALQFLTGEELLAGTVLMGGILVVLLALTHRDEVRARAPHVLRGLTVALVIAAVLVGPLVAFQLLGPRHVNHPLQPLNTYVADLGGFVVPTRFQWLSTPGLRHLSDRFTGSSGDYSVYLGVPLLALLVASAWRLRRQPAARVAAAMTLVSMVLSLGGRLHVLGHITRVPLPALPLAHLPLLQNLLPDRLAVFTLLSSGILLALLVADLNRRRAPHRGLAWLAVFVAVAAVMPTVPAPTGTLALPPFFTREVKQVIPRDATVLITPRENNSSLPMAAQVKSDFYFRLAQGGVFTPDGFASPNSAIYDLIAAIEQHIPPGGAAAPCRSAPSSGVDQPCRAALEQDLRRFQIAAVIVIRAPGADRISQVFTELFNRPPTNAGGVRYWMTDPIPA
jgi:hypothetical protein